VVFGMVTGNAYQTVEEELNTLEAGELSWHDERRISTRFCRESSFLDCCDIPSHTLKFVNCSTTVSTD